MFVAKTYGDGSVYNETDIYGPEPSVFDFDISGTVVIISDDAPPFVPIYADVGTVNGEYLVTEPTVSGQVGQRPLSGIFDLAIFDSAMFG